MKNKYSLIDIDNYLKGNLSSQDMYEFEKVLLSDNFLQEAVEGYQKQNGINTEKIFSLQQKITKRVQETSSEKDSLFFGGMRLGMAATACVLFILVVVLYLFKTGFFQSSPANSQENEVHVNLQTKNLEISLFPYLENEKMAVPSGGTENFIQYLTRNHSIVLQDTSNPRIVQALATISTDSAGKVVNVQLDGDFEEEIKISLHRLIMEGPAWQVEQGSGRVVIELKINPADVQ